MKTTSRFLVISIPALAVGLAAGAWIGFVAYEKAFGSSATVFASQAANYAFLLKASDAPDASKPAQEVVDGVFAEANRNLVIAASLYDRLDPNAQAGLARAARVLVDHPLARRDDAGNPGAELARRARECFVAGGSAQAFAACARREIEKASPPPAIAGDAAIAADAHASR